MNCLATAWDCGDAPAARLPSSSLEKPSCSQSCAGPGPGGRRRRRKRWRSQELPSDRKEELRRREGEKGRSFREERPALDPSLPSPPHSFRLDLLAWATSRRSLKPSRCSRGPTASAASGSASSLSADVRPTTVRTTTCRRPLTDVIGGVTRTSSCVQHAARKSAEQRRSNSLALLSSREEHNIFHRFIMSGHECSSSSLPPPPPRPLSSSIFHPPHSSSSKNPNSHFALQWILTSLPFATNHCE